MSPVAPSPPFSFLTFASFRVAIYDQRKPTLEVRSGLERRPPPSVTSGANSLGQVGSEYRQPVSVTRRTRGDTQPLHAAQVLRLCTNGNRTRGKTPWLVSSHDTTRIQESTRISCSCYKTNKIYWLLLLFRIYEISSLDSVRQCGPSNAHTDSKTIIQYQKANCQKTRVKAEFRHNK